MASHRALAVLLVAHRLPGPLRQEKEKVLHRLAGLGSLRSNKNSLQSEDWHVRAYVTRPALTENWVGAWEISEQSLIHSLKIPFDAHLGSFWCIRTSIEQQ